MRCAQVTSDLLSSVAQAVDREVAAHQRLLAEGVREGSAASNRRDLRTVLFLKGFVDAKKSPIKRLW